MSGVKPKIAIDATALPKEPVGAGRYIINMVRQVLMVNQEFEIKVIAHRDDFDLFELGEDFKQNFLFVADYGRGFRLIWEQIGLPLLLINGKFDGYHGLHYTRPVICPCPVITTIHDMTFFVMPEKHTLFKRYFFRFFIRYSSRFSKLLLSVSENTKKDVLKYINIADDKIMVTTLGVSENYRTIKDSNLLNSVRLKYDLPEKFALFVGLIEPRKNIPLLLEAFAEVIDRENWTGLKLVVAGRWGWASDDIKQLVEELNIQEDVFFPGYIDEADLPAL